MTSGSTRPDDLGTPAIGVSAPMQTIEVTAATSIAPVEGAPAPSPPPPVVQAAPAKAPSDRAAPNKILVIDIGGTKVKMLMTGQTEPVKFASGKDFTPTRLVERVQKQTKNWDYEAISIGYPGLVGLHGPRSEPGNLGPGWVGFDFAGALGKPVKMTNDAAMQALGSYENGRMLFLGLGTGLGSTLITGHIVIPLELGRLMFDAKRALWEVLGRQGMRELGKPAWRKAVVRSVTALMHAFLADYVVVGGGNAKYVKDLPPGVRLGHNLAAFRGGFRLWSIDDVWVLAAPGDDIPEPPAQEPLKLR